MKRFVIEGNGTKKLPQWFRTSFIGDDRTVYLPCAVFADEVAAFMALAYDGNVPTVRHRSRIYAPTWWLIDEYPKHKEAIETMRDKILCYC